MEEKQITFEITRPTRPKLLDFALIAENRANKKSL